MTAESNARALCAALYSCEMHHMVHPIAATVRDRHVVAVGSARNTHRTVGYAVTPEDAWAQAEAAMRREIADMLESARRDRDRAEATIARLSAALSEVDR